MSTAGLIEVFKDIIVIMVILLTISYLLAKKLKGNKEARQDEEDGELVISNDLDDLDNLLK